MLDQKKPTLAAYVDMLKGYKTVNLERQQLHRECVAAYNQFVAQKDDESSGDQ